MEIKLNVKTSCELSNSEKELLLANIEALLNEVRPDLVNQGIEKIEWIEVSES